MYTTLILLLITEQKCPQQAFSHRSTASNSQCLNVFEGEKEFGFGSKFEDFTQSEEPSRKTFELSKSNQMLRPLLLTSVFCFSRLIKMIYIFCNFFLSVLVINWKMRRKFLKYQELLCQCLPVSFKQGACLKSR